jgi:hypothetical protein
VLFLNLFSKNPLIKDDPTKIINFNFSENFKKQTLELVEDTLSMWLEIDFQELRKNAAINTVLVWLRELDV